MLVRTGKDGRSIMMKLAVREFSVFSDRINLLLILYLIIFYGVRIIARFFITLIGNNVILVYQFRLLIDN